MLIKILEQEEDGVGQLHLFIPPYIAYYFDWLKVARKKRDDFTFTFDNSSPVMYAKYLIYTKWHKDSPVLNSYHLKKKPSIKNADVIDIKTDDFCNCEGCKRLRETELDLSGRLSDKIYNYLILHNFLQRQKLYEFLARRPTVGDGTIPSQLILDWEKGMTFNDLKQKYSQFCVVDVKNVYITKNKVTHYAGLDRFI